LVKRTAIRLGQILVGMARSHHLPIEENAYDRLRIFTVPPVDTA
jgi:hypothetical protein